MLTIIFNPSTLYVHVILLHKYINIVGKDV